MELGCYKPFVPHFNSPSVIDFQEVFPFFGAAFADPFLRVTHSFHGLFGNVVAYDLVCHVALELLAS